MKTIKFLAFASIVAGAIALQGCSRAEIEAPVASGEKITATLSVSADAETKATADNDGLGASVKRCIIQVRMDGDVYEQKTVEGTTGHYQTSIDLISGQKYDILAWVDGGEEYYTLDADGVVTSCKDVINDDAADAFYGTASLDLSTSSDARVTIYAKRPFAQLNLITKDLKEDFLPKSVSVKFEAPKSFDLINGTFGDAEEFSASFTGLYKPYKADANTVVMAYVFADAEEKTILDEIELGAEFEGSAHRILSNIPVLQNYRTNVTGKLFANSDNIIVDILPGWGEPSIDHAIWDGSIEAVPAPDASGIIHITNPNQLAGLAAEVNAGKTTYKGYTVVLDADLDLDNCPWTPIGNVTSYPSVSFGGTFDGQGHTISHLNASDTTPKHAAAGLFGSIVGTVKNLNLKDVCIYSTHYAGAVVGYYGTTGESMVSNCHVDGGTITSEAELTEEGYDNGDKVGGIFGYSSGAAIDGCSVKNVTILGYRDLGGIVGYSSGSVTNNVVEDVTILQDFSHDYKNGPTTVHEIAGTGSNLTGNTFNNVTISQTGLIPTGTNSYKIVDAYGLVCLAKQVNADKQTFAGKTIMLDSDIDLNNEPWTPIGALDNSASFAGTFDGQNHTISNLTVTGTKDQAALFGFVSGATVKNLKIKDVNIEGSHNAAAFVAYDGNNNGTIDNCHVDGGTITSTPIWKGSGYDNGDKVGGIAGQLYGGHTITNCSVKNLTMTAYRDLGGVIGHPYGNCNIDGNSVENVVLVLSDKNAYKSDPQTTVAAIAGRQPECVVGDNTFNNVTIKSAFFAATQDAFNAAVKAASAGSEVRLAAGTYTIPAISKNITISGVDGVKFNCTAGGVIASIPNGATFENCVFDLGQTSYHGFTHAGTINMNGCTLNGLLFSYGDMNFKDCHFIQEKAEYNMWAYGNDLIFTDCVFDSCGKFLNVYNEGSGYYKITCIGCKFNTSTVNKPALNIKATCGANGLNHDTVITNCTANFTIEASTSDSKVVGSALWQVDDINASVNSHNTVTVDGVKVYDGK